MVDIKISGRKVSISEALHTHVDQKIGDALKVFDITPMSCDVVLRVDKNPSNPDRKTAEVTVFVRNNVVRVTASSDDMYVAIDEAAEKVSRQLRKYKTKVVERRHHVKSERGVALTQEDLAMKSGVGLCFVRNLEQGKQTLKMDKVNQLLDLFNYELTPTKKQ